MSLAGPWSGIYHYPFGWGSNAFLLSLDESGSVISGLIEEPDALAIFGGGVVYATFSGQRTGGSIVFEKVYEDPPEQQPAITYAGSVNADETRIEGEWIIHGEISGTFVMQRRGAGAARSVEHRAKVDR
jgi:hypothetical protein